MILEIRNRQREFSQGKSDEEKKILGQYFTDSPIAEFMSSLIDTQCLNPELVRLLDCGAGHGILTASTALHLLDNGIKRIDATIYELDEMVINDLAIVLEEVREEFNRCGRIFNYNLINDNFVTLRPDANSDLKFDVSVINPPYFKYSAKDSIYSKKTADLFKGDPNIYATFIAIALSAMAPNGQIVVISPRSFLNGLYFKGFRKYLLNNSKLDTIHIFKSRKDVFVDSDILQENIIFKLIRDIVDYNEIVVSSSNGISDLQNLSIKKYPKEIIIDSNNTEDIIRIPESENDFKVLQIAENLPSTFSNEGYFISTGPVVEHRTKSYLTSHHQDQNQVPLIKAHNVLIGGVFWDGKNKKDLSFDLNPNYDKHLVANKRYVILKRFTSKDEKRRLVAGVYEPLNRLNNIGITNKLNYIGRKDSTLSHDEALGLVVLFNSKFMDDYYRCISGNTQVNATDIRIMKTPTKAQIIQLGRNAKKLDILELETIELITKEMFNE